jgi:hypothetical protein
MATQNKEANEYLKKVKINFGEMMTNTEKYKKFCKEFRVVPLIKLLYKRGILEKDSVSRFCF